MVAKALAPWFHVLVIDGCDAVLRKTGLHASFIATPGGRRQTAAGLGLEEQADTHVSGQHTSLRLPISVH